MRSSQNIPPKQEIAFTVTCDPNVAGLLRPMQPFFQVLCKANCLGLGADVSEPEIPASITVDGMRITIDMGSLIDVDAEIARNEKLAENLSKMIQGKLAKLQNASFVERAPAQVVEKERQSLQELEQQRAAVTADLEKLRTTKA
jgi:valyl-tRNA synthetase